MKIISTKSITLSLVAMAITLSSFAQSGSVKIRGTRFTYPVVKKWIAEFSKQYPNIKVEIAGRTVASDSVDLNIAAYALGSDDFKGNREGISLNRYAQLPIINP